MVGRDRGVKTRPSQVYTTSVRVGTCRGPHSIVSIKARPENSTAWHPVWAGPPEPSKEAFLRETRQYHTFTPFPVCVTPFRTKSLRLELDTITIDDWNELDYIELVGSTEKQPATFACAASGADANGAGCAVLYVPDADFAGADDFAVRHCDCAFHDVRCSEPAKLTIDVSPVPDAPEAVDSEVDRVCGPFPSTTNVTLEASRRRVALVASTPRLRRGCSAK